MIEIQNLVNHKNYNLWFNHLLGALQYCRVDSILTGDWTEPAITAGNAASTTNAMEWESVNTWIGLNLTPSDAA